MLLTLPSRIAASKFIRLRPPHCLSIYLRFLPIMSSALLSSVPPFVVCSALGGRIE